MTAEVPQTLGLAQSVKIKSEEDVTIKRMVKYVCISFRLLDSEREQDL